MSILNVTIYTTIMKKNTTFLINLHLLPYPAYYQQYNYQLATLSLLGVGTL